MKICIVASAGGHLQEIIQLVSVFERYEYFYVINNRRELRDDILKRTYFITRSERDWKFALNLIEAFSILRKERPKVIISAGAGCAVPLSLVGKFVFGCKVVFIESFCAVYKPTVTGRVMYRLADLFIYQWEYLAPFFPKGIHGGFIF